MAARAARAVARVLPPLVPLAAAAWMWWPLLDAYFYADDFLHLFDRVTLGAPRFLTQIWGGHLYLVRNAVFLALFDAFGPDPRPFFCSMLVTHLVNVALLSHVIRRLSGNAVLACLGATLWATCPTLAGALGWYSVYGQVLLTTLVLVVIARLAALVATRRTLSVGEALAWGSILAVGGACFGSGLGVAAVFPLVALIVFPPAQRTRAAVVALVLAALAILAIYTTARLHAVPDLDPRARALLSPQALLAELPVAVVLAVQLLAFGMYSLVFGFLGLAGAQPVAAMAIGGAVAGACLLAGWRAGDAAARRCQLGLGLLALAAYGTVAVGRTTSLEFLNLPAAHAATWPRYHYLGLALLAVVACTALASVPGASREAAGAVAGGAAVWIAARLLFLVMRPAAFDLHDGARAETERVLAAIRSAVAATPSGGVAAIQNRPFGSAMVPWLFPGWAGVFVIHFPHDTVDGRTVRFRVDDKDWALAQARGGRIASLVERR